MLLLVYSMYEALGRKNFDRAILALVAAALLGGIFFITVHTYIHPWDERYHALVASNLIHHPLKPTLVDIPYLPVDPESWSAGHIWMHKQPFFLWLMAGSIRLFGHTYWAIRIPSLLGVLAMLGLLYSICTTLDREHGKRWGYWAALLLGSNAYIWNMTSGLMGMDHNDIIFMTLVTTSFWCWVKLEKHETLGWSIGLGLAMAAAVLTKWLTGLLVLEAWGLYHLLFKRDLFRWNTIKQILPAAGVTAVLVGSWVGYCLTAFPAEMRHELAYHSKHIWEAVEGHSEPLWFYFKQLPVNYFYAAWLLIPGVLWALYRARTASMMTCILACIVTVYLFFTFANTKMNGYVLMVLPLMCLLMAYPLGWLRWNSIAGKTALILLAMVVWCGHMNLNVTWNLHLVGNNMLDYGELRDVKTREQLVYRSISPASLDKIDCLMGVQDPVVCMFFTGKTAYSTFTPEQADSLLKAGVKMGYLPEPYRRPVFDKIPPGMMLEMQIDSSRWEKP